jgi:tetratricopeptide (TPR) repeat protein
VGPGPAAEGFGLLVPALSQPDAGADPALLAAALVTAASVAELVDVATARRLAEQAVEVARQLGDERLLSSALAALCGACFFAGEPEEGRPFGQEAVERARRLGDDVLLAEALLGYVPTIDPASAGPLYAEAFACTGRSGDHLINSTLHNNASIIALSAGDVRGARAHLEAAHAAQQIGWDHVTVQLNLGDVLRAEKDLDGARSTLETALRISRRNGDTWNMAAAIFGLACLASETGDWHRAAVLHGAAQALQDRTGNPWKELSARGGCQVGVHLSYASRRGTPGCGGA